MFKYLWEATFTDNHMITQPADDLFSGHIDGADHNFTAFKDLLNYQERSPLQFFALVGQDRQVYAVNLETGEFFVNGGTFKLDQPLKELENKKIIYHRTMRIDQGSDTPYIYAYNFGYEGNLLGSDKIVKRIVSIS